MFWIVLIGLGIWWGTTGFPPIGFPQGEYTCDARSGVQEYPISVFNAGLPMKVFEYQPGGAVDISNGMRYSHATFATHLNLYLGDESYYCEHRG